MNAEHIVDTFILIDAFVLLRIILIIIVHPGLFQSVILLSRLPFINLFYEVLASIAPKYFAGGESVLQNACLDISNWPPLQAGECIQLPLLGSVFQTYIPSLTSANLQQPYSSTPSAAHHQIEDLKNVSLESTEETHISTSSSSSNDPIKAAKTNTPSDDQSTKNDNNSCSSSTSSNSEVNNVRASSSDGGSGGGVVASRADILDSYKQSKEMLLAQQQSTKQQHNSDSPCDSNSSKSIGANNANDYNNHNDNENQNQTENSNENDNDNGADVDLDEYFNVNYRDNKFNERAANTQHHHHHHHSTNNIERTLRLAQQTAHAKTPIVLSSVTEIDIFRSLYTILSYVNIVWELVLTAEPIVVMATSPTDCSHMVQSLMR